MARTDTDNGFRAFWDAYGLKRDRIAAERAWNRLSQRDRRAAMAGIAAYRDRCRRAGISMMYGQGYLSHRRWEDADEDTAPVKQEPESTAPSGEMAIW